MKRKTMYGATAAALLMVPAYLNAGDNHGHEDDFVVGRTAAGRLAVEFDFTAPTDLPPVLAGNPFGLMGWAGDDPGFMALDADEPVENFFTLGADAFVVFEIISLEPALKIWSPGFANLLDMAGDQFVIGSDDFDVHATFFIDAADPGFDPRLTSFDLRFRLVDAGSTNYSPTDTLTATFTAVPEPTSLVLVGVGVIACVRQCGRRIMRRKAMLVLRRTSNDGWHGLPKRAGQGSSGLHGLASPDRATHQITRDRALGRSVESTIGVWWAIGVLGTAALPAMAQHNTDLWVGVSDGRIAWQPDGGLEPGSVYHPLTPNDIFGGWSDNDPGFDRVTAASGNVGPLPPGVEIWLELATIDPALFAIGKGLDVLEFPGDATILGDENLHAHITWFIDGSDPGFVPEQCVWEGTFRLTDEGRGFADSDPFTLLFTNEPVRNGGFPPPPVPVPASGDFNDDGQVEFTDGVAFGVCLNGPNLRPHPNEPSVTTCEVHCHNAFDFDDDLDVDLLDYAEFQVAFEG